MRITIIGNCGSGKSTLAHSISKKLNIPHIHLDRFWFEAGGHKLQKFDSEDAKRVRVYMYDKVKELIAKDSWVSDGWYSRVQPIIAEKANHIVFLNIPLGRRIVNHIRRIFYEERHPELSRWDDFKFILEMIKRTFTRRAPMRKLINEYPTKIVCLRSYKEIDDYFQRLYK